jgi:transcriptional antiterminator NusG
MILTVRTTVGRENAIIDSLTSKIKSNSLDVKCIFYPGELKGYIFLEGDEETIGELIKSIPHIKGMIKKEVNINEIRKFLEVKKIEFNVSRGDVVEIIGGPFKNEKGKVTRVDESKGELTIELLDAAIPIPITIPIDSAKVIESAERGGAK